MAAAAKTVQVHVSRLRKAPTDALETRAGGYALNVDTASVDLFRFEELTPEGRRRPPAGDRARRAAAPRRAAFGAARRCPTSYTSRSRRPITRLEELRVAALEDRIEPTALGESASAVPLRR